MQCEFYRCVRFLPWWKTGGSSVRKSHSQLEGSVLCCKCGRFKTKIRVQVLLTSSLRCVSVLIGTENPHSSAAVAAAALIRSDGCPLEVIVKTYSLKIAHIFIWLWGVSLNINSWFRFCMIVYCVMFSFYSKLLLFTVTFCGISSFLEISTRLKSF